MTNVNVLKSYEKLSTSWWLESYRCSINTYFSINQNSQLLKSKYRKTIFVTRWKLNISILNILQCAYIMSENKHAASTNTHCQQSHQRCGNIIWNVRLLFFFHTLCTHIFSLYVFFVVFLLSIGCCVFVRASCPVSKYILTFYAADWLCAVSQRMQCKMTIYDFYNVSCSCALEQIKDET